MWRALPRGERDDIVAELRESLQSRIEAREQAAGRPLGDDEMSSLLREFGHPLVVAARYGKGDCLLPAALVPHYKVVLLSTLVFIALLHASLWTVRAVQSGSVPLAIGDSVPGAAMALLAAFTVITLVFMALGKHIGADSRCGARSG